MKRILNLNDYGMRFVGAIGLLGVVMPALLYLAGRVLEAANVRVTIIAALIKGSLAAAAAVLVVFLALVALEWLQDDHIDRTYFRTRGRRLPAADGYSECPFCGNRRVQAFERRCGVCGKELAG